MIFTSRPSHKVLLNTLPFGIGYTCEEDGDPCMQSVMLALSLYTVSSVLQPMVILNDGLTEKN